MSPKPYAENISATEECLKRHGDTAEGVGWPRGDAHLRYPVLLGVLRPSPAPATLLDFGCGASHLQEHLIQYRYDHVRYSGLDLSPTFLDLSRRKFPSTTYYQMDILDPAAPPLPDFDYVVMSGIFSYRGTQSQETMFQYLRNLVLRVWERARVGLAFNCITKQVDWEREDLFHVPVDPLLTFLSREVSRHVVIRHDYGLYEYTVYVHRDPVGAHPGEVKHQVQPA